MRASYRIVLMVVVVLAVLGGGWTAFASYSNGTRVEATVEAGTEPDGSMFFRCVEAESSAGVCDPADPKRVVVHERDRVHLTVRSLDKGRHVHDFFVDSLAYGPPYPWVELELEDATESTTFTAWKAGEFRFECELAGHAAKGMWGTLVVHAA